MEPVTTLVAELITELITKGNSGGALYMVKKTRFYLLRHGETIWNKDNNRYCGISDISLSAEGRQQVSQAADFLAQLPISAIYSSPLQRAKESAGIIARRTALKPQIDPRLMEQNFGEWEGLTSSAIAAKEPELWEKWLQHADHVKPGGTGETGTEVYLRATEAFLELQQHHEQASIVIVGHNTFNRIWLAGLLGMPIANYRMLSQDNMNITIIDMIAQSCKLVQLNGIEHLRNAR